jgi:cyclopropane-fatty-acyl-phospholipid synthase
LANGLRRIPCPCSSCSAPTPSRWRACPRQGPSALAQRAAHRLRDNKPQQAKANIAAHYDLGNDFYSAWLDETMTYSAGLWRRDGALADAQRNKIDQLLDRLKIREGYAPAGDRLRVGKPRHPKRHGAGANVVGLTLSTEQKAWAEREIEPQRSFRSHRDSPAGLSRHLGAVRRRGVGGKWSRPSVGAGWGAYIDCIARNLKPGGPSGAAVHLHAAGSVSRTMRETRTSSRPTSSPAEC